MIKLILGDCRNEIKEIVDNSIDLIIADPPYLTTKEYWDKKEIERIIKLHTKSTDLVLDPFLGSGTTGIVCKQLNRNFIGIENNPIYFDLAKKRIDQVEKELFTKEA